MKRSTTYAVASLLLFAVATNLLAAGAHHHHRPHHATRPKHTERESIADAAPVLDTARLAAAPETQRSLTQEINKWSNVRYRHGGTSARGVDCSGFIYKVFEHACAVNLPRSSREQSQVGEKVGRENLQFGDLLFFYSKKKSKHQRINHVAMYTGDGNFVHSHRHGGVGTDSLDESYYAEHFAWACRVLPANAPPSDTETLPIQAEF